MSTSKEHLVPHPPASAIANTMSTKVRCCCTLHLFCKSGRCSGSNLVALERSCRPTRHCTTGNTLIPCSCPSLTDHHMAGMANTAPRPCLFTLTHSTCTCTCYDQIKGTQEKDFSYSFSDSLSPITSSPPDQHEAALVRESEALIEGFVIVSPNTLSANLTAMMSNTQ